MYGWPGRASERPTMQLGAETERRSMWSDAQDLVEALLE